VLLQQIVCALGALGLRCAFGFGSAISRAIGLGFFRRFVTLNALLEAVQIDNISHGYALPLR
jgi:hypothetical protein